MKIFLSLNSGKFRAVSHAVTARIIGSETEGENLNLMNRQ